MIANINRHIIRFTGEKFVFRDDTAVKGQSLPEKYKKLFVNKQIVCRLTGKFYEYRPESEYRYAWNIKTSPLKMKERFSK